jgi:hypothetical protein
MSLRPEEVAGTLDERVLIAPDEVLENDRSSVVTGMVIARAWRDPGYRSRLLSSPREVLIEEGLEIPDGMAIRAFADTPAVRHIHLTSLTTEAEELVPVFREMLPLPAGSEIRLIQNTEQALCLVVPLAPPEPESLTDTDVLRRLAPRASAFAAGDVIATVVSDAWGAAAAAAAAAAAVNTTQTETASATAFVQESGEVVTTTQSQGWTMSVVTTPGVESATESMATSEAAADTSVSTQTDVVTLTNTYTTTDVSTTSWESTSNVTTQTTTAETTVTAVEAEAAATTTTVVAEGEAAVVVVAVGAAVLT